MGFSLLTTPKIIHNFSEGKQLYYTLSKWYTGIEFVQVQEQVIT